MSIKYTELYNEYVTLTRERYELQDQLALLCSGYISIKTINGKKQNYLQRRENGKMKSEYIRSDDLDNINRQLNFRIETQTKIKKIDEELDRLEKGIAIISPKLSQRIYFYKQGAVADSLSAEKRRESLAFSNAMTAMEGLAASETVNAFLDKWIHFEASFTDFYLSLLEKYNVIERVGV